MADNFANQTASMTGPIENGYAITPSDSVDHSFVTRALWVGTGGNVSLLLRGGASLTMANVPSGTMLPIRVVRVNATGTTATDLVGLY